MAVRANANVAAFASAHRRAPLPRHAVKGGRHNATAGSVGSSNP